MNAQNGATYVLVFDPLITCVFELGSAENWLISFTQQLRVNLPQGLLLTNIFRLHLTQIWTGQYIVTHARK
jgi:hypothetical protein